MRITRWRCHCSWRRCPQWTCANSIPVRTGKKRVSPLSGSTDQSETAIEFSSLLQIGTTPSAPEQGADWYRVSRRNSVLRATFKTVSSNRRNGTASCSHSQAWSASLGAHINIGLLHKADAWRARNFAPIIRESEAVGALGDRTDIPQLGQGELRLARSTPPHGGRFQAHRQNGGLCE